jgi:hypothetical protein
MTSTSISSSSSSSSVENVIDTLLNENPSLNQAKIRIDKKTQQASVVDVIRLITNAKSADASKKLTRLGDSLRSKCPQLRINGKGRLTPVADAPTLVEIIWELPGKAAKYFRRQSAHWVCRILGGDLTLANEIENRYKRISPEQKQLFLQNTDVPLQSHDDERRVAKRTRELDLEMKEETLKRMKIETQMKLDLKEETRNRMRIETESMRIETAERSLVLFKNSNELKDDHMRAAASDYCIYLMRVPNSSEQESKLSTIIEISSVCSEMNAHFHKSMFSRVGKVMKKLYIEKYNEDPPKTQKYCNGKMRDVNAYYKKDKDLMCAAISSLM